MQLFHELLVNEYMEIGKKFGVGKWHSIPHCQLQSLSSGLDNVQMERQTEKIQCIQIKTLRWNMSACDSLKSSTESEMSVEALVQSQSQV